MLIIKYNSHPKCSQKYQSPPGLSSRTPSFILPQKEISRTKCVLKLSLSRKIKNQGNIVIFKLECMVLFLHFALQPSQCTEYFVNMLDSLGIMIKKFMILKISKVLSILRSR